MEKQLKKAIRIIGGPVALSKIIGGITSQAISQWEKCPPGHVLAVEKACKGKVSRYKLRPDIFGKLKG